MNNAARRPAPSRATKLIARLNANSAGERSKTIADRKAEAARLVAKLQGMIASVPADGSWGQAGDLGHYIEQLQELVGERG